MSRKRSPNWLASEKDLLLSLVSEHFNIIESKRTDAVTMKNKLAEWRLMSEKYNSQTTHASRSAENLKAQWDSMKKAAKKEASNIRMHLIQTGGGPPKPNADSFHERIMGLIKINAVGLHNPFDNDNINGHKNITQGVEESVVAVIETIPAEVTEKLTNDILEEPTVIINEDQANCSMDWGDYTPRMLQTPISKPLRVERTIPNSECHIQESKSKLKTWSLRRRPMLPANTQEDFFKKKIEALALQIEHAKNEREEQQKLNEIEYNIRKEKLKQEKLKTRLMLLELRAKKN